MSQPVQVTTDVAIIRRQAYLTSILPGGKIVAAADFTTMVSTKGQVILPKAMREQLQWPPGTQLRVEHVAGGVLLSPSVATFAPTRPEDVAGCLPYTGKPVSIEDMDAGIAKEATRRHARGRY